MEMSNRPQYVNVIGETLIAPHSLSDMCEQIALRVASLDGNYKRDFDSLLEQLITTPDSEETRRLAFRLQAAQQEVKEVFQKIRGQSNPYVVTDVCPICKHMKIFDNRDGYCSDCAQGDPVADLEES